MDSLPKLPREIIECVFAWACSLPNSRETCNAISVVARFAHAIAVRHLYTTIYVTNPTRANIVCLIDQLRKPAPNSTTGSTYASFVRNACFFVPSGYGYPVDKRRKEKERWLALLAQNIMRMCINLNRIILDETSMGNRSIWSGRDMAGPWPNLEVTLASYSHSISPTAIIDWSQVLRSSITRLHTSGSVTSFHDLHTLERFMPNLTHVALSADVLNREKQAIHIGAQILPPRIKMIVFVFASSFGLENAANVVSGLRRIDTRVYMVLRNLDYRADWLHDVEGDLLWSDAQKQSANWDSWAQVIIN
jgi:hypothetical protein